MEITLRLNREDYINYYLWSAFKFGEFNTKKKKSTRQFLIAFTVLAAFFLFYGSYTLGAIYLVAGILLFFFYPIRLKKLYVKHYNKYVDTKLVDHLNKEAKVVLNKEGIDTYDVSGEYHLHWTAIQSVYEVPNHFYLILNAAQGIIIPKAALSSVDEFVSILKEHEMEIIQDQAENQA